MKKILITGGAGFLGTRLCEILLQNGHEVICADSYYTSQKKNILHLLDNPCFEAIRHDVVFPLSMEVDEIYNLACPAAPGHYQFDPVKTLKASIIGSLNLLELADRSRAKILQTSTSEVYGNPQIHPQPESYFGFVNPIGPRACYDEGKRVAETLFVNFHKMYGTQTRIVRLFNAYGPGMHPYDGRVISNFIRQGLKNEPIKIYGDGTQTRSFCYCDDLLAGMIRMMENKHSFTGPVNLGNPEEITIADLAEKIIALSGSRSEIQYQDLPVDDPTRRQPDITLAGEKLDWKPVTCLTDGLKKTIEWFRSVDFNDYRPPTPCF